VLNNIGYDLHMLGQYQSARATYQEAIDWARKAGERQTQANILVSQADLLRDLGEAQWAADLYSNALKIAQESGDNSLQSYVFWEMADLNRTARNFPAALEWLRRADLAVGQPGAEPPARHVGLNGAILTEMGDIQTGRTQLEQAMVRLDASEGSFSDLAWVILLLARCQFRLGWLEKSETSLTRALKLARDLGYDQMLVREAEACRDLLEGFSDSSELGPQVRALLARARSMVSQKEDLAAPIQVDAPSPIQVHALGSESWSKNKCTQWVSQRARELFFFLVDRAPVNRDELLATFWPDIPQGRALTNLYQTLYRLRRALGEEVVVLREQTCHFSENLEMRYDVASFESLARSAVSMPFQDLRRVGALEGAIQAYSGEYLAYLPVDWARQRREELSEEFVRVLREYADELIAVTRYSEARAALSRALAAEPLRDDLHQRMLKVLAAQGRIHEVVDHYQHYCESLRREMGLDPPAETRSLYGSLIS
jgi:DNA-binding SARP family transcriptional activator